jgi:hypothetical protein
MSVNAVGDHAPKWFRDVLRERYGADCVWDPTVCRWAVDSPSAGGKMVRQLVVWRFDPTTGEPLTAAPGEILPFRELTPDTMQDILRNMERTSLLNPHDGAGSWKEHVRRTVEHNEATSRAYVRKGAELFALGLAEVDLKRPWIKFHSGSETMRRIARRV